MGGKRVNLFPEIIERKPELGGVSVLELGRVLSGKTALLVHIARRIFERKRRLISKPDITPSEREIANELIFWIDDPDCQWRRLPNRVAKKRVLVHRELYDKIKFYQDGQLVDVMPVPFKDFDELMELSDTMMLNVVYLPARESYIDFFSHLVEMPTYKWFSVFVDELERILRQYIGGDELKKLERLVDLMGRGRKRRVSIYAGTHNKSLVHWQFSKLIMYYAFLLGAREVPDTRVQQRCIDALKLGEFRLATAGVWDNPAKRFPAYTPTDDMVTEGLEHVHIPVPIGGGRPPSITKNDKLALSSDVGKGGEIVFDFNQRDNLETIKENTTPSMSQNPNRGEKNAPNKNSAAGSDDQG